MTNARVITDSITYQGSDKNFAMVEATVAGKKYYAVLEWGKEIVDGKIVRFKNSEETPERALKAWKHWMMLEMEEQRLGRKITITEFLELVEKSEA